MAYDMHHVPGRLRLRLPQFKQRPQRMGRVDEALQGLAGVDRIEHKRSTGSVVVYYDPDVMDETRILNALAYNGLLDRAEMPPEPRKRACPAEKAGQAVGRMVFSWAVGRALDSSGLSFLAALI